MFHQKVDGSEKILESLQGFCYLLYDRMTNT